MNRMLVHANGTNKVVTRAGGNRMHGSVGSGGSSGWLANKPANYTTIVNDFGWNTDPTMSPGDHVIGGGWSCIYGDQFSPSPAWTTTLESDATEPVSPPLCFQWHYVIDTKSGYGTPYLTNTFAADDLYIAFTIWHDSNFEWNTISNKLLVVNPGNMYFQSRHDASNWWQVSFLDLPATYNTNLAVGTIPTGVWVNVEFLMKRHATLGEIHWWIDGVKIGEYTGINVPGSGSANDVSLPSTWGGATPNTTRDSYRRIGHIHIATP